jgi:hypothetical protein
LKLKESGDDENGIELVAQVAIDVTDGVTVTETVDLDGEGMIVSTPSTFQDSERPSVFGLLEERAETAYSIDQADREDRASLPGAAEARRSTSGASPRETVVVDEEGVDELFQIIISKLRDGSLNPSLFSIVQRMGAHTHRKILAAQEEAAAAILAEPDWGERLKGLTLAEVKQKMTQQIAVPAAASLAAACGVDSYRTHVDEVVMPAVSAGVAASLGRKKPSD